MSLWNLFTYETLCHAIAGSAASCFSMTVFYPLDTVRCRLQIDDNREAKDTFTIIKEIIEEEGCESLYRGLNPVLISLAASGFVYFYSFHGLRTVFAKDKKSSPMNDLLFGAIAGCINIFLTSPLWVVNTRIKMQKDDDLNGILDGLIKISKQEGVKSLWSGALPSLLLVSNPSIQFMIYEQLKTKICKLHQVDNLPGSLILLIGATAKSISTLITYPLQVMQTKLRHGNADLQRMGIIRALINQFNQSAKGLYKGLESKLYQTVLSTALMYFFYEKIITFIFRILLSHKQHI